MKPAGEKWSQFVTADLSTEFMDAPLTIDDHLARLATLDDTDLRIMRQRMCSLDQMRRDIGRIAKGKFTI